MSSTAQTVAAAGKAVGQRVARRSVLAFGATAIGSVVVAGRATRADAATNPVELGPATLLQRPAFALPAPNPPTPPAVQVPG